MSKPKILILIEAIHNKSLTDSDHTKPLIKIQFLYNAVTLGNKLNVSSIMDTLVSLMEMK